MWYIDIYIFFIAFVMFVWCNKPIFRGWYVDLTFQAITYISLSCDSKSVIIFFVMLLLLPLFTISPESLYIVGLDELDGSTGNKLVCILLIGVNKAADEYSWWSWIIEYVSLIVNKFKSLNSFYILKTEFLPSGAWVPW